MPPPLDYQSGDWAERVQSIIRPCDEIEHTTHGYDDTPDYDAFWRERDYLRQAKKVRIPVLVAHNWGDYNVKQSEGWNWFHALTSRPSACCTWGTATAVTAGPVATMNGSWTRGWTTT